MNNNKLLYILFVITACVAGMGCKKYLSEMPDNRTTINSKEKIEKLLAAAYDGPAIFSFVEPMTDNVSDGGNLIRFFQVNDFAYRWKDNDIDEEGSSPLGYWLACYRSIAYANQALASLESTKETTDASASKGEALLVRAYYHFMLMNLWAKPYNSVTAATDPGIPYVTEVEGEPFKHYKRATVKENYDSVEKDLLEGMALVKNNQIAPKFKFSPDAARAFASRFYLYKGDWGKVIRYATEILPNPAPMLRDWAVKYTKLGSDYILPLYSSPEEPANIMVANGYCNQYQYHAWHDRFGFTPELADKLGTYSISPPGLFWAYNYDLYELGGNSTMPKFNNNFVYTSANSGNDYMAYVVFSYDEALINRAEAYAMTGDNANAIKDLSLLYTKKLFQYDPVANPLTEAQILSTYPDAKTQLSPSYPFTSGTQAALVQCVTELRRKEFLLEGMRWFDIRRFNIEVTHPLKGTQSLVLKKDDPRRVLQIPKVALEFGLTPNNR